MPIVAEKDPQHIAIVAALAGAAAPDVLGARVVDVACGDGEGLVAAALALPGATFVGIDARVDAARALADAVGASNVRFVAADAGALAAAEALDGPHDIVIADGVWSSLDDAGQRRLLAWLGRALSPRGLVYLSFDALPGARMLDVVRATLAHVTPDVAVRRDLAAGLLAHFEAPARAVADPAYAGMLGTKAAQLAALLVASPEAGALLDELSSGAARASWFGDVAERTAEVGLAWVAEARTSDILDEPLEPAAAALAESLGGDAREREEYADFLRGRTFRRSIFARARGASALPEALHVVVRAAVVDGRVVTMQRAPLALEGDARALVEELLPRAPEPRAIDAARVAPADPAARRATLAAIAAGALRAFVSPPRVVAAVSERPRAIALARRRAAAGAPVYNAYGERVALDDVGAALLAEIDGRPRDALVDALARIAAARKLPADRARVAAGVDAMLGAFAASALLEE